MASLAPPSTRLAPWQGAAPRTAHAPHLVAQRLAARTDKSAAREAGQRLNARPNRTGLPDRLKAGVEQLSGLAMDDVRVMRNSARPAQLHAHAYAQGGDIHLAPGAERHLPHEAWHVVQQKQGRVRPTLQLRSNVPINDDAALEREADQMGARAAALAPGAAGLPLAEIASPLSSPVQREIALTDSDAGIYENDAQGYAGEEYYYVKKEYKTLPIFVPCAVVDGASDEIDTALERELDTGEDAAPLQGNEEQIVRYALLTAANNAHFYTAEAGRTDVTALLGGNDLKAHLLRIALRHPLVRNPNAPRGLAHRYADPNGVLFSRLSQSEAEEKLSYALPPTVTFYHVRAIDWYQVLETNRAFWTEVTEDFAYGRHANLRAFAARAAKSKFRQKALNTADSDHVNLQDDSLTALLPPVPAATTDSGWIDYKAYANPKDRGSGGQYKAMRNWNALAYAAYWSHHGTDGLQLGQDWEWLHIRGAQNGGATRSDNLVAGTSTTNSRMIPWEDRINSWTNHANAQHPLSIRFEGERFAGTCLGKSITISVAMENGLPEFAGKIAKAKPMVLEFDPIAGTVFDRVSERLTAKGVAEQALKANAGVQLQREYVVIRGNYKGMWVQPQRQYGWRVTAIVKATGQQITVDAADLILRTTELDKPLPPK